MIRIAIVDDDAMVRAGLRQGASGVLNKDCDPSYDAQKNGLIQWPPLS